MKLLCNKKEFAQLITNCNSSNCSDCILYPLCSGTDELTDLCEIVDDSSTIDEV